MLRSVAGEGENMRACILISALITLALALTAPAVAQYRTFGGFDCTVDCSGHSAGYKWAEKKDITDEADCPYGNSQSFHEGCIAYTQDEARVANEDDDGRMVGHRGRRSMAPADDDD